ncbi:MAG: DNA-deoxyinosine glycosylase [Sphingobium sp.]
MDFSAKPSSPLPASLKSCFAPVVDGATRLLILGSLPGECSLAAGQYYANPGNDFWRLVGAVVGVDLVALGYEDRLRAIQVHGIGLWDVIAQAERVGSLDSAIRNERHSALGALVDTLPALVAIAFNGQKAAKVGLRQLGEDAQRFRIFTLLSSSGACAVMKAVKWADWMRLGDVLR